MSCVAGFLLLAVLPTLCQAGPLTREEGERQAAVLEALQGTIALETTGAARFAALGRAMNGEGNADFRGRVLELAAGVPGGEREAFLTQVLATDEDAGVRSRAARLLGELGSEKSLAALVKAARTDRTTQMRRGDIGLRSSARRDATFAIGSLGRMKALSTSDLMEKLLDDPQVSTNAAIALFQITGRKVKQFPEGYDAR